MRERKKKAELEPAMAFHGAALFRSLSGGNNFPRYVFSGTVADVTGVNSGPPEKGAGKSGRRSWQSIHMRASVRRTLDPPGRQTINKKKKVELCSLEEPDVEGMEGMSVSML